MTKNKYIFECVKCLKADDSVSIYIDVFVHLSCKLIPWINYALKGDKPKNNIIHLMSRNSYNIFTLFEDGKQ